ncbi:DUF3558 family protein [Nocardia sp. NPDC058658]|uniref:DUF3558 family protein n=1 Tax=Nocardia sp. NPDC058658 TaxID=3346580 RepID=UPI0036500443
MTVGCTSDDGPARPISVQVSKANGPVPIQWDPCFKVNDNTVSELGFDPTTRRRETYLDREETKTGCRFTRKMDDPNSHGEVGWLVVITNTLTLEQLSFVFPNAPKVTIDGREGISIPEDGDSCGITMTGPDGTIAVRLGATPARSWDPCEQIENAARVVESTLPK